MSLLGSKRQLQEEKVALPREDHAKEPPLFVGDQLAPLFREIQESIARRAYEFFDARGGEGGQDLADWFRAESELVVPVDEKITQSGDTVTVRAAVPGFSGDDLKIGVEPRRIVISGKREESSQGDRGVSLRATMRMLSTIDLPAEVDPGKTKASFQGNEITISLYKSNVK